MTKKPESILNSDVFLNKVIVRIPCYYWTDPRLKKIHFPRSLSPYPLEMNHLPSRAHGLSVMCFSCVSLHTFYTRAVCPVCSSMNLTQDLVFVFVLALKTNKATSLIGLCLFQVVQTSQLREQANLVELLVKPKWRIHSKNNIKLDNFLHPSIIQEKKKNCCEQLSRGKEALWTF